MEDFSKCNLIRAAWKVLAERANHNLSNDATRRYCRVVAAEYRVDEYLLRAEVSCQIVDMQQSA